MSVWYMRFNDKDQTYRQHNRMLQGEVKKEGRGGGGVIAPEPKYIKNKTLNPVQNKTTRRSPAAAARFTAMGAHPPHEPLPEEPTATRACEGVGTGREGEEIREVYCSDD